MIIIGITSLSTVCLVCQSLIEFDPARLIQDFNLWTLFTCHLASTSILELAVFLLITNYLIDQLQHVWTLKRFSLMFITSCLLQSLSYWGLWLVSNLVVPRRWILGEKAVLCGLSSLMIFILLIIRMEQPERQVMTRIPAVTKYLEVHFAYLPQLFCAVYFFVSFLLEQPFI